MITWNLCDPDKRLPGWDLSKWQGKGSDIDWERARNLGVTWVVAKAFSGGRFEDSVKEQILAAQGAGMLTGVYGWWYPTMSDQAQVDAWSADLAWLSTLEIPFTIDVEEVNTGGADPRVLRDRLYFLTSTLYQRLGRVASIYTGDWYWRGALGDDPDERFADNPNWHAAYPSKKAVKFEYEKAFGEVCSGIAPRLAAPWRARNLEPWAWQFDGDSGLFLPQKTGGSERRSEQGGSDKVDVDVNLASIDALASMIGEQALRGVREHLASLSLFPS